MPRLSWEGLWGHAWICWWRLPWLTRNVYHDLGSGDPVEGTNTCAINSPSELDSLLSCLWPPLAATPCLVQAVTSSASSLFPISVNDHIAQLLSHTPENHPGALSWPHPHVQYISKPCQIDLGDTVRQEYCKFSEHQLLPESSTPISFKQFALRMSSFLRRLFKNLFKNHVFFLKERLIFICNVHTDIPPGK